MAVEYNHHYLINPAACGEPFREFVKLADEHPGLSVLDLGCGQGRDALLFARNGCTVHGVDISPVGIEQMLETAKKERLKVTGEVNDIENFETRKKFDVVILDRVLHMLGSDEDMLDVLEQACSMTKSGGWVLVADGPKNRALIKSAFDDGWVIEKDAKNRTFARRL